MSVFLQLPADVSGHFVYTVAHASGSHSSYGSRALPFGWNWSPLIAQRFIGTIMAALDSLLRHWWLYIDDLWLAHSDPVFLTFLGAYACHWLRTAGFIISPKSVLAPAQSITWLGKHLDARTGITNLPTRHAQVLLAIWTLRTTSCSARSLQRVLGSLQWLACPHSLVGPWLAPVYQYLFSTRAFCLRRSC